MNDSRGRAPQVKSARVSPGGSERNYNRGRKEAQHGFETEGSSLCRQSADKNGKLVPDKTQVQGKRPVRRT